MRTAETESTLTVDGWVTYKNQFAKYAKCYYKRFPTPTRCHLNDDKEGMQIQLAVTDFEGNASFELELVGELADGTWFKLHNYALPKSLNEVLTVIPRMLATWEAANA